MLALFLVWILLPLRRNAHLGPEGRKQLGRDPANNLDLFVVQIDSIASFNYTTDESDIGVSNSSATLFL